MTPEPPQGPTRECPYCHSKMPLKAVVCSTCWKDLRTGAEFKLGDGPAPSPPRSGSGLSGTEVPPSSIWAKTKTCMHCGAKMAETMLLCPVCNRLQQTEPVPSRAIKSAKGVRLAMALLVTVAVLCAAAYLGRKNWDALREYWRNAIGPATNGAANAVCAPAVTSCVSAATDRSAPAVAERLVESIPALSALATSVAAVSASVTALMTDAEMPEAAPLPALVPAQQSKRPADAKALGQASPAGGQRTKVVCPGCNGEGYYMRNPEERDDCPICRTSGYRMLSIPTGRKLCPDCKGLGNVERKSKLDPGRVPRGLRKEAMRCERCSGLGYVKGA